MHRPIVCCSRCDPALLNFFLLNVPVLALLAVVLVTQRLGEPLQRLRQTTAGCVHHNRTAALPARTKPARVQRIGLTFGQLFAALGRTRGRHAVVLTNVSRSLQAPLAHVHLATRVLPSSFFQRNLVCSMRSVSTVLRRFVSFVGSNSSRPIHLASLSAVFGRVVMRFTPVRFICRSRLSGRMPMEPLSVGHVIVGLIGGTGHCKGAPVCLSTAIMPAFGRALTAGRDSIIDRDRIVNRTRRRLIVYMHSYNSNITRSRLRHVVRPFRHKRATHAARNDNLNLTVMGHVTELRRNAMRTVGRPRNNLRIYIGVPLVTRIGRTTIASGRAISGRIDCGRDRDAARSDWVPLFRYCSLGTVNSALGLMGD